MSKLSVVVVGNGMVGHHFVEQLAHSGAKCEITVIGGESRPAYDRVHLSAVFEGKEPAITNLSEASSFARSGARVPMSR